MGYGSDRNVAGSVFVYMSICSCFSVCLGIAASVCLDLFHFVRKLISGSRDFMYVHVPYKCLYE